jgi:prepilin-type processing-associated H-X9-DG protein
LVWKESKCGGRANCAFYDGDMFRMHLHSWTAGFTMLAVVFEIFIVLWSKSLDLYGDKEKEDEKARARGDVVAAPLEGLTADL